MRALFLRIPTFGIAAAVFAILATLASGPGYKIGLWDFPFGLKLIEWAIYTGL